MLDPNDKQNQLSNEAGCLMLSGDLDHAAVANVYQAGRSQIRQAAGTALRLDLSRLDKSDSASLALLLDWSRYANENSVQLELVDVPRQLHQIANVCGLGEYLDSMAHAA